MTGKFEKKSIQSVDSCVIEDRTEIRQIVSRVLSQSISGARKAGVKDYMSWRGIKEDDVRGVAP